ncbi:MAG TPA: histidine kinase N-terminal 7TM domain-containing protein, partial [Armatimonadota bacterium]
MTFFALTALTNTITSFFLGLLVLRKKTPAHMGKDFARFCVTATLWSLAYFIWQHAATPASALFWCQLLTCFSSFLPLTQLIFICNLLNIKHHPLFTVFLYGFSCLTAVLSFTPLMIAGVRPMAVFPFWPHAGSLYGGYLLIWMALIVYGQVLLITRYRTAPPPLKTLLYYLIIATLVGYLGGATNYPLWFGLPILPYGNIGVTFYVIIFAYAIARQRVLNIRIVRTEALVFLIFAILLIDALAVTSVAQAVVRGVLLGLFALVAFKFVRSLLDLDAANRQLEQDKRTLIE